MGASFIGVAIVAQAGCLKAQLEAGLERAKKVSRVDDLPEDYYSMHTAEPAPHAEGNEFDQVVLEEHVFDVRDDLIGAFEAVLEDYDNGMQSFHFESGDREIMFTGGMSWGDFPSDLTEDVSKVLDSGLYYGDRLSPESEELRTQLKARFSALTAGEQVSVECMLDELIHELYSSEAARVNNTGVDGQIDYLIENYEPDALMDLIAPFVGQYLKI